MLEEELRLLDPEELPKTAVIDEYFISSKRRRDPVGEVGNGA